MLSIHKYEYVYQICVHCMRTFYLYYNKKELLKKRTNLLKLTYRNRSYFDVRLTIYVIVYSVLFLFRFTKFIDRLLLFKFNVLPKLKGDTIL